jgi:mannose/fructose/N-acetylgalactosamine-specific phosphotransferase system component IIC
LMRRVFPVYDRVMAIVAVVPAVLLIPAGAYSLEIYLLLLVAAAFIGTARFLLPIIDRARQDGNTSKFSRLHRVSVLIHAVQMIAIAVVFVRLAQ